ncbi:MAG TPA: YfiR family protein [Puia sp.]|nr:YfiR family protein [Puia sp.]
MLKLLCITGLSLMSLTGGREQHDTDYKIYANIIYRFTKYIDWPVDKKSGDFIIGIVGESPLYSDLKILSASKKVGNQKIVVMMMSPSANFYNCQILFISEEESSSLKRIATLSAGASILIVSESGGLARKGSCINFVTVDERLKLEINKGNIEQRNLGIASELLELGIIIK